MVIGTVAKRMSALVCNGMVKGLRRSLSPAYTLTLDNGSEFCAHGAITKALETRCYFARPYAAWERGLNENHNGLVRRYIPKKASLANYTQAQLDVIAHRLNNRPRKRLGYLTPQEFIDLRYSRRRTRALRS